MLAGSVTAPGAVAGWGAPVAVVAAVVALLVASGAVAAAAPVVTPEGTGIFSQVGLPPLGVSSVPGKNPPPTASGILTPPHPVTHQPETLRGARQAISGQAEVARRSLFPGLGGWAISLHPPQHPRTVSSVTVPPAQPQPRKQQPPSTLGAVH